jgi:hypothetical protein
MEDGAGSVPQYPGARPPPQPGAEPPEPGSLPDRARSYPTGYLARHPLPDGIVGALSLGGYALVCDLAGVGVGRLGEQVFLLFVPDPDPALAEPLTQISLHASRLRAEQDVDAYVQVALRVAAHRLSGYRLTAERCGLRSKLRLIDPASGALACVIPERMPSRWFGGQALLPRLVAELAKLPVPGGRGSDAGSPLRAVLLTLALADPDITGAEAPEVADRALALLESRPGLDPLHALKAARAPEP